MVNKDEENVSRMLLSVQLVAYLNTLVIHFATAINWKILTYKSRGVGTGSLHDLTLNIRIFNKQFFYVYIMHDTKLDLYKN